MSERHLLAPPAASRPARPWYTRPELVERYESWYEGPTGIRMDRQEKAVLRRMLDEAGWLGPRARLLEVGAGTGHFTRWLKGLAGRVVGVDLSPLMLRKARELGTTGLVGGDAARLPFASGSFDAAVLVACFEYMPHPVRVLQEVARVARCGLVLGLMNRRSVAGVRRRLQVALGRNDFFEGAHLYTLGEIRRLAREAFGGHARLAWRFTLYPPGIPVASSPVGGGSFLAVRVELPGSSRR
ncbi:MAG: class I SAM-dependent methyltransferase [Limnochordaceae bacterium]|nr:class I SAM-dependent methyltransferase [Limnochordaceae bacterium]